MSQARSHSTFFMVSINVVYSELKKPPHLFSATERRPALLRTLFAHPSAVTHLEASWMPCGYRSEIIAHAHERGWLKICEVVGARSEQP